jgi:hypothetical protein
MTTPYVQLTPQQLADDNYDSSMIMPSKAQALAVCPILGVTGVTNCINLQNNSDIDITIVSPMQATIAAGAHGGFSVTTSTQPTFSFRLGVDSTSELYTCTITNFRPDVTEAQPAVPVSSIVFSATTPMAVVPFEVDASSETIELFDPANTVAFLVFKMTQGSCCAFTLPLRLKEVTMVTVTPEVLPVTISNCTAFSVAADGSVFVLGTVPASTSNPPVAATFRVITDSLPSMAISTCA